VDGLKQGGAASLQKKNRKKKKREGKKDSVKEVNWNIRLSSQLRDGEIPGFNVISLVLVES